MLVRSCVVCAVAFLVVDVVSAAEPPAAAPARRPNIVFLLTDQWRASAAGYAGDPNVKTPHLDALAAESLDFRNAVSVCPICTPYRAALMTGRYPTSTGMFLNDAHLPAEEFCIAEALVESGYETGYIGKWHLDGHGRTSFVPPERRQGWQYWKAAECDHDYLNSHYYEGPSGEKRFWEGYDAYAQTKDAQAFIRGRAGADRPFALVVSFGPPHFPHGIAPADMQALYPPATIRLRDNVPEHLRDVARREAQGYYAHCTAIDRCVGGIVATLAEAKLADHTIVVFTSDHGEMLGSHGCKPTVKQVCYAESAHVPFLLRYPRLPASRGRIVEMPITTPDISATLLGLAGVPVPASFEGEDLSGVLRAGGDASDRLAVSMLVAPFNACIREPYRAIRTRRHTFVRGLAGPWMLFDDQADPHQLDNLVAKPGCARLRDELDAALRKELARIGDDFRSPSDSIAEFGYAIAPHGSLPYGPKNDAPQTPRRRAERSPLRP